MFMRSTHIIWMTNEGDDIERATYYI